MYTLVSRLHIKNSDGELQRPYGYPEGKNWKELQIPKDGLISYYKMDETSGDVVDSHGNNDGTNYDASRGVTGKIENGVEFAGVYNEYIDCNFVPPTGNNPRTLALWIWPDANGSEKFLGYGEEDVDGGAFNFTTENDTKGDYAILFRHSGGSIAYHAGDLVQQQWQHVLIVVPDGAENTSDVEVYLDNVRDGGTRDGGSDQTLDTQDTNTLKLGTRQDSDKDFWTGKEDELGVWDRELESVEREALYNVGSGLTY